MRFRFALESEGMLSRGKVGLASNAQDRQYAYTDSKRRNISSTATTNCL